MGSLSSECLRENEDIKKLLLLRSHHMVSLTRDKWDIILLHPMKCKLNLTS